jgi:hypothetical protein
MTGNAIPQIDGAQEVSAFLAGWPSFHDAEVLQLALVRDGISKLVVDVATYSNETDEKGQYRRARQALVTFDLERIVDLQLEDFSMQNVLSSRTVEESGIRATALAAKSCVSAYGSAWNPSRNRPDRCSGPACRYVPMSPCAYAP